MERTRAWRRYILMVKVIHRLRYEARKNRYWRGTQDTNKIWIPNPMWFDLIGTNTEFEAKSFHTHKWQSRYKSKWGKRNKKSRGYYGGDNFNRIKDKEFFTKLLKEEIYESI